MVLYLCLLYTSFEKGGSADELNKLIENAPDFSVILEEELNNEQTEKAELPVFEKNKFKIKKTDNDIIDLYLDYVSSTIDSPDIYHITSAILIISLLLERKVYFQFGTQQIYANIWAVIVAPSTTYRKSSSINIAKNFIRTWFSKYLFPEEFKMCIRDRLYSRTDLYDLINSFYFDLIQLQAKTESDTKRIYKYTYACLLYTSRCV